jgi:hypothetical protein
VEDEGLAACDHFLVPVLQFRGPGILEERGVSASASVISSISAPTDDASARTLDSISMRDTTTVYRFDPLSDSRWNGFLASHPGSSVFHSSAWLTALRLTYKYEPIVFTTCPCDTELRDAAVFCRVDSWLTGRRLVSLPFSDHCDLLVDDERDLAAIHSALAEEMIKSRLLYIEVRPSRPIVGLVLGPRTAVTHCLHGLDLSPSVAALFGNLHKSSTQRKIRHAERDGLTYEEGRSDFLLDAFNRLWFLTRRRHLTPPQPANWFRNLIECFGEALKIRVAFKGKQAVAAIITLHHKDSLVYKYGCSDASFHNLGGMHLLLWRSIQEAKQDGLRMFDFGRSDWSNRGLITFKDRWGARRSELTYLMLSPRACSEWETLPASGNWKERSIRRVSALLPDSLFRSIGNVMYRHVG